MRQIEKQDLIKKLKSHNLHWVDNVISPDINEKPKRGYFAPFFALANQFTIQRAIVLMGPRRVGKTILLHQTIQEFINNGIAATKIYYVSLDEPLFSLYSLENLIELCHEATGNDMNDRTVIIFDEIQYVKNWDVQLKILVDNHSNIKFIASGSAAGALKRQSQESGAGRFTDFMLPPLTFFEYLDFLNLTHDYFTFDENRTKAIGVKNIDGLNKELINYINYGGFPEVIFNPLIRDNAERFIRQDIIDKVLLRDLPSLYGISNIQELNRFFTYLCYQTGNEISYEALSKKSSIAANTVRKYIEYLQSAFLIRVVSRVDERGKTFKRENFIKVYLTNPSMYTALYGTVSENETTTLGNLVETTIFSQYGHDTSWLNNLYYARFNRRKQDDDREVDMVYVDQQFKVKWCLEVKWSDRYPSRPTDLKSLIAFCEQSHPLSVTVSTKSINETITLKNGITIEFKEAALICFNIGYKTIVKHNR